MDREVAWVATVAAAVEPMGAIVTAEATRTEIVAEIEEVRILYLPLAF